MRPDRARPDGESLRHVAVPYDSDDDLLRLLLPRVRAALREGRRVLAVVTHARLELLRDALGGDDARRLDSRARASWYAHPHRALAACHEYTLGRRTLVVGEPPWPGHGEREVREWIRYESVVNAALGGAAAELLCLYGPRDVPEEARAHVPLTHPYLLGPYGETPSPGFVEPHELVLTGDDQPLPGPSGQVESVRFTAPELRRLRHTVGDYARAAGMDRDRAASLVLSVSEIAANSVEHGAGHGTITMWVNGRELICELADPGGALEDPLPGYIPPEPESSRGYGLWISRQLCDLVELRTDDGTLRVRLHMRLGGRRGTGAG
ncbi:anti-sigma factor RsbA family regulatory protein [Nonomuraea roseoviolacea]|uniref:Anti-sigma regulatory factor (Ser/Thr protein kinase) n=1 Tax=Nonomuraea roseoviolacea subsp. carminata TaxID=160689 RepID=A0ABT1K4F0_9ACTN|nr:anti-sigma factor RsbA family regulatory protein [Nonomuraea roseoviolacea]MCP2348885.1 anti-sigma regulatory factor (Ser/Thr protein kinase) [Nonomuraea roseoviolacea subsp. carminata]